MYSVLIYNKRTAESFKNYRPLFADAIRDGEMGTCEWDDRETEKIEVALPRLYNMIGDKKEWRAIVVQSYLGDESGPLAVDKRNPFDYVENRTAYENEIKAAKREGREENLNMKAPSTIPLIILSQMLGGVPKQSPVFVEETETVFGTTKERKVLRPQRIKEDEELYAKLCEKYKFHANRPKELLLIAVRPQQTESLDMLKESWKNYDEILSSQFWTYNHYAEKCRFLTYEIEQKGNLQLQGDLLKLWLAVGLLTSNHLDASSFQASFLYHVKLHIDNEKLAESFHSMAVQLASASSYLKRSISQDHQRYISDRLDPPEYGVFVDVTVDDGKLGSTKTPEGIFGLVARDGNGDIEVWRDVCSDVDRNLQKMRRMIGRSVESTAGRMRGNCQFSPEEVAPMTDFQSNEFKEQLKDTYQKMLDDQVQLHLDEIVVLQQEKERLRKRVLGVIKERLDSERVKNGYYITIALSLLAVLPSVFRAHAMGTTVFTPIFGALFLASLVYFIAVIAVCRGHLGELKDEVSAYDMVLISIRETMTSNARAYSEFLRSVGSHMKGSSYINILRHKEYRCEDITQQKKRHLREISKFRRMLEEWARSVYVPFDFDIIDKDNDIEFNDMDIPNFYSLYTLEFGQSYQIPINKSGTLTSRYSFITGLEVVREDLYDDFIFSGDSDDGDSETPT